MTDDERPLYAEAAAAILGTYRSAVAHKPHADATVAPFKDGLDAAERTFVLAAGATDRQGMIEGWNALSDLTAQGRQALVELAVFLLASAVNLSGQDADAVMAQALLSVKPPLPGSTPPAT